MNSTIWQLALRRWAEIFASPFFYLAFFTTVIGITAAGPSGIFSDFTFFRRLGFSFAANASCWSIALFVTPLTRIALEMRGMRHRWAVTAGLALSMILMLPVFYSLMMWEFSELSLPPSRLLEMFVALGLLVIVITYGFAAQHTFQENNTPSRRHGDHDEDLELKAANYMSNEPFSCPIQQKIPAAKRGTLLGMVAQDHYVEVITDKGSELVLMRLSDAVALCSSDYGLQIHRSAWVTKTGLADIKKEGRKLTVVLLNGRELPVARSANQNIKQFADKFDATG